MGRLQLTFVLLLKLLVTAANVTQASPYGNHSRVIIEVGFQTFLCELPLSNLRKTFLLILRIGESIYVTQVIFSHTFVFWTVLIKAFPDLIDLLIGHFARSDAYNFFIKFV